VFDKVKRFVYDICKVSFSLGSVQQIMLYYVVTIRSHCHGSLDTWTVIRMTAAKFSPLYLRCGVSPCQILLTFSFSWLWMISACILHNIMKNFVVLIRERTMPIACLFSGGRCWVPGQAMWKKVTKTDLWFISFPFVTFPVRFDETDLPAGSMTKPEWFKF
jgi:hypothetical protein